MYLNKWIQRKTNRTVIYSIDRSTHLYFYYHVMFILTKNNCSNNVTMPIYRWWKLSNIMNTSCIRLIEQFSSGWMENHLGVCFTPSCFMYLVFSMYQIEMRVHKLNWWVIYHFPITEIITFGNTYYNLCKYSNNEIIIVVIA